MLANIYLNPLDWLLESLGLRSVRYADDIVVLAADAKTATHALDSISEWMAGAELTLHPDKTRIGDMNEADAYFDFLGYRFKCSYSDWCVRKASNRCARNSGNRRSAATLEAWKQ